MIFSNVKLLDENFQVRQNMFVQTKDEKISYIGEKMPEKKSADEEVYDGTGKFLMNGFFNTHCHVPMRRSFFAGLAFHKNISLRGKTDT